MKGAAAPPPALTPQTVAIAVSQSLKAAGFTGNTRDAESARYRLAEKATGREFVASYRMLSPQELEAVWHFVDNLDVVKVFLADFQLHAYRERARELLHGFQITGEGILFPNEARDMLQERIAQALKDATEGDHRAT